MIVGPYVDLLHEEKGRSNLNIRARLFLDISDACSRLKDLEDYIMSSNYLSIQDEDAVMLILLVLCSKGRHLWTYTSGLMHGMFEKIENFRIFKQINPEFKKVHKYIVVGFMFPFKGFVTEVKVCSFIRPCFIPSLLPNDIEMTKKEVIDYPWNCFSKWHIEVPEWCEVSPMSVIAVSGNPGFFPDGFFIHSNQFRTKVPFHNIGNKMNEH
uniref:Uncharacterized protein n=1 Tax=Lactuca sativa TaxID=4236 RepID=A0A9R1WXW2_LACSA|nr:hypothetical protein LSAT_V11C800453280 [Lactuca sativa]